MHATVTPHIKRAALTLTLGAATAAATLGLAACGTLTGSDSGSTPPRKKTIADLKLPLDRGRPAQQAELTPRHPGDGP